MPNSVFRQGVRTFTADRSATLVELVASELNQLQPPPSLSALELIELGAIYVAATRSLAPNARIDTGTEIRVHASPRRFARPPDLAARILHESNDTLVVEKPFGLPAEATVDNVRENLVSFLEDLRGQSFSVVHRLETETEGLLLIAKSREAAIRLTRAFGEGRIRRRFIAHLEASLRNKPDDQLTIHSVTLAEGPTNLITEGRTTWMAVSGAIARTYRVELETSALRPKEIRAAFANAGSAIIGDRANGSRIELKNQLTGKSDLALKSTMLSEID